MGLLPIYLFSIKNTGSSGIQHLAEPRIVNLLTCLVSLMPRDPSIYTLVRPGKTMRPIGHTMVVVWILNRFKPMRWYGMARGVVGVIRDLRNRPFKRNNCEITK
jgi:hypothetical protein